MSRNQDRLGGAQQPDTSPPPQQGGGGFSFVIPTEFVDLPSLGRFYAEGHPLHGQDSIEIKQMTAKEEDILTNQAYIEKGIVLDKLLEALVIGNGEGKKINLDESLRTFVEFGVENYEEANTRFLLENNNWSGLVLDSNENYTGKLIKVNIERSNQNSLFGKVIDNMKAA